MLIYVAGAYSHPDRAVMEERAKLFDRVSYELAEMGHMPINPIAISMKWGERYGCKWGSQEHTDIDLVAMFRSDAVVFLPNWAESEMGAHIEHREATEAGIPIWYYPDLPPLHPTEVRCPEQARNFMMVLMRMYRTHLSKNHDYSPANILATGEIGLVTRLWDKVARLMNLSGFHFDVVNQSFDKPAKPKNESIEDTLEDAAVYSVIGLLLRRGVWGK